MSPLLKSVAKLRGSTLPTVNSVLIAVIGLCCTPAAMAAGSTTTKPLSVSQVSQRIIPGEPIDRSLAAAPAFERVATKLCMAASRGSIGATVKLGWMHVEGAGVAGDLDIAASLFKRAAAHGDQAARNLANAFQTNLDRLPDCLTQPRTQPPPRLASGNQNARHRVRLARTVARMARRYRLDPRLVLAIVQIESAFRPDALSPQNATGLMQLTPDTAERFGVNDINDPIQNLHGGMAYLRWLLAYFEGDITLVAAAYNSGEGNVNKYGGVPPFIETMNYVAKLQAIYHRDWHPYNRRYSTRPSPVVASLRREAIEAAAFAEAPATRGAELIVLK